VKPNFPGHLKCLARINAAWHMTHPPVAFTTPTTKSSAAVNRPNMVKETGKMWGITKNLGSHYIKISSIF